MHKYQDAVFSKLIAELKDEGIEVNDLEDVHIVGQKIPYFDVLFSTGRARVFVAWIEG